jgi:hypothetical protein
LVEISRSADFVVHFAQVWMRRMSLERIVGHIYMGMPFRRDTLESLVDNHILFPFNFMLFRPHAEYCTKTLVKLKRGEGTGQSIMHTPIFMAYADGLHQTIGGSFSYMSTCLIKKPENIHIFYNTFVDGYVRGMNGEFYDRRWYRPDQNEYGSGSLFVVPLGYTEKIEQEAICLSGRFPTKTTSEMTQYTREEVVHYLYPDQDASLANNPLQFSSAALFNAYWSIPGSPRRGPIPFLPPTNGYIPNFNMVNTTTFHGHQRYFNIKTHSWDVLNEGNGHWKKTEIGCNALRRGEIVPYRIPVDVK